MDARAREGRVSEARVRGAAALAVAAGTFVLVLAALRSVASTPTACPDHATGPASDAPVPARPVLEVLGLRR